jgi:hypothetical protein
LRSHNNSISTRNRPGCSRGRPMAPDEARCVAACARRANHLIAAGTPLVSRTRRSVLPAMPTGRANARPMTGSASSGHAAPQSRDPFGRQARWTPDQQRTTPQRHSASKTRVNVLMALRSIRGTAAYPARVPPVPDAVRRSSRCSAEPGPKAEQASRWARIAAYQAAQEIAR